MKKTILLALALACAAIAAGPGRVPGYQPMFPVSTVTPAYPKFAASHHQSGEVVLNVTIGADGEVKKVRVVSGPSVFYYPAVTAVSRWRYQPAMMNGTPVAGSAEVRLTFQAQ